MKKKALIIGGGFAGCAAAHVLALKGGWDVTIVEKSGQLGAGVRTMWYGGHAYTFGPRHFLTPYQRTYDFLNKYLPLRSCEGHIFYTFVEQDQAFYNYPIHEDDIARMPEKDVIRAELKDAVVSDPGNLEDYWKSAVGPTLYRKFIENYSKKMWQVESNTSIDDFAWSPKGVALKKGPRAAWDSAISAYPVASSGYDDYFDIATKEATVLFNTEIEHYDIPNKTVIIDGVKQTYDVIVNTISPDLLFESCHGDLEYLGRQFFKFVLPVRFAFPDDVHFVYYAGDEPFTRIVEYKKFTRVKYHDDSTILGLEIPAKNGGRDYPMPFVSEIAKAQRYFSEMPDGVFSIGRAGKYEYGYDIDNCILDALEIGDCLD